MNEPQAKLTEGSVARHLTVMTLPVLGGIFAMMLQSFADAYFIGQVGATELAALSFAFPVLMVVTSVAIGLGAGTSSVVARAIGSQNPRRVRRLTTDSLIISFLITMVITTIGIILINPLFRAMGVPPDMMPMIREYMLILYFAVPFVVVGMVGMSAMRATGDTMLPSVLMVAASVGTIALDPILIFGLGPVPAMELNGAALALALSRIILCLCGIGYLHWRLGMLSFSKPDMAEMRESWRDISHVGIPAAATNAIIPLCIGVITAMLARHGPEVVAGFGVASRIESMTLVMFYAMSAIIGPFVGQNLSARKTERIFEALRLCVYFSLAFGLVVAVLLAIFGEPLSALFSENAEVVRVSSLFLLIAPIGYGAYGMVMVMNASFNGMARPMPAVAVSVIRMGVIYVPIAFVADRLIGIEGIFVAYTIANILTGILAYAWARRTVADQAAADEPLDEPVAAVTITESSQQT